MQYKYGIFGVLFVNSVGAHQALFADMDAEIKRISENSQTLCTVIQGINSDSSLTSSLEEIFYPKGSNNEIHCFVQKQLKELFPEGVINDKNYYFQKGEDNLLHELNWDDWSRKRCAIISVLVTTFLGGKYKKTKEREQLEEEWKCSICLEVMERFVITPCNHNFHVVCLQEARKMKKKCPLCRTENPTINWMLQESPLAHQLN